MQVVQTVPHVAVLQTMTPTSSVIMPDSTETTPEMNADACRQRCTTYLSAPLSTFLQPYVFYNVADAGQKNF